MKTRQENPKQHVDLLFGRHAVEAALHNQKRRLIELWGTKNALQELRYKPKCKVTISHPNDLEKIIGHDEAHQGLVLKSTPLDIKNEDDLARIDWSRPNEKALMLDQVTDPRNIGAIIRSAVAFGVDRLILQDRHSPTFDRVLAKTASGAREHISIYTVTNLSRTLQMLREEQAWSTGLSGAANIKLSPGSLHATNILVLGAEGKGMRRLVGESCDDLQFIPIETMESLNVSNAAAIALFNWGLDN